MTVSVIVYGRNDGHGYNMHKRVAISLNAIAEKLQDVDDEIIFVDWNSPDHLPTLIEDIFDTLTPRTQELTRVFRVRSSIHQKISPSDSNRPTIEPYARNVGIRRSNPNNKWILNTNTDMVFLTEKKSLSVLFEELPTGFYNSYRFEIPEYLWNSSSRLEPAKFLTDLEKWRDSANLIRKVYLQREDHRVPDAPGDFQLAPRDTFFKLNGFPESMLYGWHVDSAMSQLLVKELGYPVILEGDQVQGFHCNHLRHLTHFHTSNEKQNDFTSGGSIKTSGKNWGLADEDIEEINILQLNNKILEIVENMDHFPTPSPESSIEVVSNVFYPTEITFTFLVDSLITKPLNSKIIYVGFNEQLKLKIKKVSTDLGFHYESFDFDKKYDHKSLDLNHASLLILDLGLDAKIMETFAHKELNFATNSLSILTESLPSLAKAFRRNAKNTELAVLGPLSWGMRLTLGNDFQMPLFNNYGQILTGRVRLESQGTTTRIRSELIRADIRNHFGISQDFNLISTPIRLVLRFSPNWLKRALKPIVYLIFRSVQKLR